MGITKQVIEKITDRAELGYKKYGQTMDRKDLSYTDWLEHLQEELMDAIQYIQAAINKEMEERCIITESTGDGSAQSAGQESPQKSQSTAIASVTDLTLMEESIEVQLEPLKQQKEA